MCVCVLHVRRRRSRDDDQPRQFLSLSITFFFISSSLSTHIIRQGIYGSKGKKPLAIDSSRPPKEIALLARRQGVCKPLRQAVKLHTSVRRSHVPSNRNEPVTVPSALSPFAPPHGVRGSNAVTVVIIIIFAAHCVVSSRYGISDVLTYICSAIFRSFVCVNKRRGITKTHTHT